MSTRTPNQDGVYGQQRFNTSNNEFNAMMFLINQALSGVNVATLVRVVAVEALPGPSVTGTVDVQPLVDSKDGAGQAVEHSTIYGIPYFRLQGGMNAVVLDPHVGDIGFCVFADRDITNAKQTTKEGPAPTDRRFNYSDGLYIGGWAPTVAPTRYIQFTDTGINIMDSGSTSLTTQELTLTAPIVSADLGAVTATAETFEITVPEFVITGNLHVTGLVHCTWEGELVAVKFGGTGADLSATGGPGMVVKQSAVGAAFTVGAVESSEVITPITLGATFAANQPFKIVAGVAQHVTAIDAALPQVDGIVLASGISGASVPAAMNANQLYQTSTAPTGSDGDDLFLNIDGTWTNTIPSYSGGFAWSVPLARRVNSTSFVFNPEPAVKLA